MDVSHDAEASLEGGRSLVLQRGNWGRVFRASDAGGLVIGEFDKKQWMREGGPVRWDGVDYEFATKSGWKGTFALSRYGEELAEFKVTGFPTVLVVTPDGKVVGRTSGFRTVAELTAVLDKAPELTRAPATKSTENGKGGAVFDADQAMLRQLGSALSSEPTTHPGMKTTVEVFDADKGLYRKLVTSLDDRR